MLIQLLEHVNQVIFCYRQELDSLQLLTICLDVLFMIGGIIHIVSIYYNKSLLDAVCLN